MENFRIKFLRKWQIVFNVSPFDSTTLAIAKNNARSHLMCITRAAPAWFEWSELFKLFDWVEFCKRLFFEPTARKIILQNSTKSKSLKCKPNSKIKQVLLWWYTLSGCGHCFSRWPNLSSKKDDTFDILLTYDFPWSTPSSNYLVTTQSTKWKKELLFLV